MPRLTARQNVAVLMLLTALISLAPGVGRAEWLPNGNLVAHPAKPVVRLAPDGGGGVYLSWETGYRQPLMLTRILADGRVAEGWTGTDPDDPPGGVRLFAFPWWGYSHSAISDESGGVIVLNDATRCPTSCASDPRYLLATRIGPDAIRAPGWGEDGDSLGFIGDSKTDANLATAPDGRGGVLGVWTVRPGHYVSFDGRELRAQRMDGTGARLWGPEGVVVQAETPKHDFATTVTPDGKGGAFVLWVNAEATAVLGQHLSAEGEPLWTSRGLTVVDLDGSDLRTYRAIPDGSHGLFVAWVNTAGILVTRLRGDGAQASNASLVAASQDMEFRLAPVRGTGALVSWREVAGTGMTIRAQRLNHACKGLWGAGAIVSAGPSQKRAVTITDDGSCGAYLAWADSRPLAEVYALHLDCAGTPVDGWEAGGSPVCQRLGDVQTIGSSGSGVAEERAASGVAA